jgi:Tfp pilus assembly protein PilW
MVFKITPSRKRSGVVLVDMLVGLGISGIILATLMSVSLSSARSFATMANYSEMSADSRLALDIMSQEIRASKGVLECDGDSITLLDSKTNQFTFHFDEPTRTVIRTAANGEEKVVLEGCDTMDWQLFQRTPKAGSYEGYPASRPELCKLVQVTWLCSRTLFGKRMHTEMVQSARIVIRNNEK